MVRIAKQEPSHKDEFENKVTAFLRLKATVAELTKEANALRDEISTSIDASGEVDDSGNRWLHLPDAIEGIAALKRERRVSRTLDAEAAEEILKEKGLKKRCYDKVLVLNEDEVMACLVEELLNDEDIDAMFPSKVSWALVTSKK